MALSETHATFGPEIDPALFEYARERATEDLSRIVMWLMERYLNSSLTHASTWPVLLEIEEQAFSDLTFQSGDEAAVTAARPRIGPIPLPGVDMSGFIDWRLSPLPLPIVYRCVRELLWTASPTAQESDSV